MIQRLESLGNVEVFELPSHQSGIVTFRKLDEEAPRLKTRLSENGINTSLVKAGNAVVDLKARGLGDINRASLHYYNTEDEIDRFVEVLSGQ